MKKEKGGWSSTDMLDWMIFNRAVVYQRREGHWVDWWPEGTLSPAHTYETPRATPYEAIVLAMESGAQ